jgi:hypothetical protein
MIPIGAAMPARKSVNLPQLPLSQPRAHEAENFEPLNSLRSGGNPWF